MWQNIFVSSARRHSSMGHSLPFFLILLVGLSSAVVYNNKQRYEKYDYIVVGAGSAGSALANRLSENGRFTVLLLEAGGSPPPISEIPLFAAKLEHEEMEWMSLSEPQDNVCMGMPGKRCFWSRAKVLGGSSVHNCMFFLRGNKNDYDNWERLGAKGWNYQKVLETFKKMENHTDPTINQNGYHGTEGCQTVSSVIHKTTIGKAYLEAAKGLGYKILDDYNGATQLGFGYLQVTQRDGLRCSTEKAFLRPAATRDNIDILSRAFVLNVTFDEQKRVKSVWYDHQQKTIEVEVVKEVILSGGTLSSPLILMRSGIGPKEELRKFNIPVISHLPGVGQNLQDHPLISHLNYFTNESVGIVFERDVNPDTIGELFQQKGPLTSPAFLEVIGFYKTKYEKGSLEWPDFMVFTGVSPVSQLTSENILNRNGTGLVFMFLRPKSRGYVKMQSADPYADPIVNPRYFSHEEDIKRIIDGVRKGQALIDTPQIQRYNPQLVPEVVPGCEGIVKDSDEYIECAVRHFLFSGFHMVGTCRMGQPEDEMTVVDPELRVKGVTGLRVADASVMPALPCGNTNAPSIMIGRKAGEMILGE